MKMKGEFRVPTDRETVWRALNDTEVLKECLPGCQEIEKTSDTEMAATLVIKVGPVKATFKGGVTLSDLDPPNGYTISGQGQGGTAGFASGEARVRLVEEEGATVVQYDVDAKVGGKLAQIGSRLIDSTAKKLAKQFFDKLAEKLEHTHFEPAGPTANEDLPFATSILDYIFRWLRLHFGDQAVDASGQPDRAPVVTASGLTCPDCGAQLGYAERCLLCRSCGYTKCG